MTRLPKLTLTLGIRNFNNSHWTDIGILLIDCPYHLTIKQAAVEELTKVSGITPLIAQKIKEFVG